MHGLDMVSTVPAFANHAASDGACQQLHILQQNAMSTLTMLMSEPAKHASLAHCQGLNISLLHVTNHGKFVVYTFALMGDARA